MWMKGTVGKVSKKDGGFIAEVDVLGNEKNNPVSISSTSHYTLNNNLTSPPDSFL